MPTIVILISATPNKFWLSFIQSNLVNDASENGINGLKTPSYTNISSNKCANDPIAIHMVAS